MKKCMGIVKSNLKVKKFNFNIGGYFGSTYSLELVDGLFLYRATTDGRTTISQINPIYENDSQFEHEVIVQSDSMNEDLVLTEEIIEKFHKYISRYCKTWEQDYANYDICDGTSWECDIWIENFRLKSSGQNKYPSNFKSFLYKLSVLTKGKIFE
jgi:hypothetical protein